MLWGHLKFRMVHMEPSHLNWFVVQLRVKAYGPSTGAGTRNYQRGRTFRVEPHVNLRSPFQQSIPVRRERIFLSFFSLLK